MSTKTVRYVGPHDAVEVADGETIHVCTRGETVTVPTELANSLLEQDTWASGDSKSTKKKESD